MCKYLCATFVLRPTLNKITKQNKKKLYVLFLRIAFTNVKAVKPLRGDRLLLTTKAPIILGTHFTGTRKVEKLNRPLNDLYILTTWIRNAPAPSHSPLLVAKRFPIAL